MCFGGAGDIGGLLELVPEGETLQSFEVSDRIPARWMTSSLIGACALVAGIPTREPA